MPVFHNCRINFFAPIALAVLLLTGCEVGSSSAPKKPFRAPNSDNSAVSVGATTGEVGSPVTVTVTVKDKSGFGVGNVIPTITAVDATGSSSGVTSSGCGLTDSKGVTSCTFRANNKGVYTVKTLTPVVATTTTKVTISQLPRSLSFSTQPACTSSGTNCVSSTVFTTQPVVQILDNVGNLITTSSATVTMSLTGSPTGATLTGNTTPGAVAGVATFAALKIDKAGSYTLTATVVDATTGTITKASSSITVVAGAATKLLFTQKPSGTTASGTAFSSTSQPKVIVADTFGNQVGITSAGCVVTLSMTGGDTGDSLQGSSLSKTVATDSTNAGLADFSALSLKVVRTGDTPTPLSTYVITASSSGTCGVLTSASTTSGDFTISLTGFPFQLALVQAPGTAALNEVWSQQPIVRVLDPNGDVVTTDNTTRVVMTVTSGSGTLVGSTSVAVVGGTATFSGLKISSSNVAHAGNYTYLFTPVNPPLDILTTTATQVITSNGFTPAALQFKTPPVNTAAVNEQMGPIEVKVVDSNGFLCANDNSTRVRIVFDSMLSSGGAMKQSGLALPTVNNFEVKNVDTVGSGAAQDGLSMTASVQVVNGIATFSNLSFSAANAHQIAAVAGSTDSFNAETSQTLTGVRSNFFAVSSHGSTANTVIFSTQPSDSSNAAGWTTPPVVAIVDAFGNVMTNDNSSTVTLECIQTVPCTLLGDHLTKTVSGGKADFAGENLRMGVDTTGVRLKATGTSSPALPITTVNSNTFNEDAP